MSNRNTRDMYQIDRMGFSSGDQYFRTIRSDPIAGAEAIDKQNASLREYKDTHLDERYSEDILRIMIQFERFIGYGIAKAYLPQPTDEIRFIDIGCGISPKLPPYFKNLGCLDWIQYVGLDPYELNPDRDYLFINGIFENLSQHLASKFDCAVFSTSLDHFENLATVSEELHKIVKPNGLVFLWTGLHDPDLVARAALYSYSKRLNIHSGLDTFRNVILNPIRMLLLYRAMKIRRGKLINKQPLDSLHFHYFTQKEILAYASGLGEIIDQQAIEGFNSLFLAIKLKTKP